MRCRVKWFAGIAHSAGSVVHEVRRSGAGRPDLNIITLNPAVVQAVPPVWMGTGMSEDSIRCTAEIGLPLFRPSIFKRAGEWTDLVAMYRELMTANGHAEQTFVGVCRHVHVARTAQRARTGWRPYALPKRYARIVTVRCSISAGCRKTVSAPHWSSTPRR